MIVLFTDFGLTGPYLGQIKSVLHHEAPAVPVIDLFADAPMYAIRSNAYLLWSYATSLPEGTVFLVVVDPGVGSHSRKPVVVKCDGRWFVGPGNGLFDVLAKRAERFKQWEIIWQPDILSNSFHGRDLFAPVAAMLARGEQPELASLPVDYARIEELPDELTELIYIDHFGNLISGIRAASVSSNVSLSYRDKAIPRVATFSEVPVGAPLCYENANGLLEIAVNQGRADEFFKARLGDTVLLETGED